MAKENKKPVKATNRKMVPESEAFQALLDLQFKVIMGNRKTRRMFMDFVRSLPDDKELFNLEVQCLLTLIVHDEDSRFDFVEKFHGDPDYMEVYHLAIDIREVLGYDVFDDTEFETYKNCSSRN